VHPQTWHLYNLRREFSSMDKLWPRVCGELSNRLGSWLGGGGGGGGIPIAGWYKTGRSKPERQFLLHVGWRSARSSNDRTARWSEGGPARLLPGKKALVSTQLWAHIEKRAEEKVTGSFRSNPGTCSRTRRYCPATICDFREKEQISRILRAAAHRSSAVNRFVFRKGTSRFIAQVKRTAGTARNGGLQ